ncbi:sensor histidine kinase [Kitasatospora cineracea]|nr:sensor histidine kinase [Kitasatospora cineracea]
MDAALAAVCFVLAGPGTVPQYPHNAALPWWPGLLIAFIGCVSLLWRHGWPRGTLAVTNLCAVAVCAIGYLPTILLLAPLMVALYEVTVRLPARASYPAVMLSVGSVIVAALLGGSATEPIVLKTAAPVAWLLLPAALGGLSRLHRAVLAAERNRAEYAERTREDEARQRVAEERLRIARELHDVVAHHLALANAQANAVARLLRSKPEQAQQLVDQLTQTTSEALREMKATVGLMRQASDQSAPLEPAPGLAHVPDLIESFASAGLIVDVAVEGESRALPPGAELTAYRIIQEALTNVTKHADTDRAEVRLNYDPDRLRITVTNRGPARDIPSTAPGYGILGMRERAHSVGGILRTEPLPGGGFKVSAEVPLTRAAGRAQ